MNSFAMSAVGGFFFGVGMIVANFLMKSLVHIGICN